LLRIRALASPMFENSAYSAPRDKAFESEAPGAG